MLVLAEGKAAELQQVCVFLIGNKTIKELRVIVYR
jgi:hypothetical protein